jgi:hypothetical protein
MGQEIERLREERDDWQNAYHKAFNELGHAVDEIERLRAAGDAIAATYWDVWQCNGIGIGTIQRAYEGWQEARHG